MFLSYPLFNHTAKEMKFYRSRNLYERGYGIEDYSTYYDLNDYVAIPYEKEQALEDAVNEIEDDGLAGSIKGFFQGQYVIYFTQCTTCTYFQTHTVLQ